jgi:phosphoglycolate phosphatase-like HAD superfamily hydrolase
MRYKNIIWDFDGVILMSNSVREYGFRKIFESYKNDEIERLIEYHQINGGLSRYHKIKYFFEKIRGEEVSAERVDFLANLFSTYMKDELTNKDLLNKEWLNFISITTNQFNHHIASGSDEKELQFLCKELEIDHHFKSISGSPTIKNILVENLINNYNYNKHETILIGDSLNDLDAANYANISFIGYNNPNLIKLGEYTNNLESLITFFL